MPLLREVIELSEIVDRYEFLMRNAVGAAAYRTLGINSAHISIDEFLAFAFVSDQPFGGRLIPVLAPKGGRYRFYKWVDINLSEPGTPEPLLVNLWVFGGPINVVLVREKFYMLNLIKVALAGG